MQFLLCRCLQYCREPLLSSKLKIISEITFVIEQRPIKVFFKCEISDLIGPLGKNLNFLSLLGLLELHNFLNFLFIFKLPFSKPFWNNFNYVSTSNI